MDTSPDPAHAAARTAGPVPRDDSSLSPEELTALLEINRAIGRHLHRDELFGALAGCLSDVVPTERFGIELPIEGDRLQGHLLTPKGAQAQPTEPSVLPARGTVCDWVLRKRESMTFAERDALRERFPVTFDVMESARMEALLTLPLVIGEGCRGALFFMSARRGAYAHLRRAFLEQVASAVAVALDDCLAHEEVRRLRDQLARENVYLQEEIREGHGFGAIVGNSRALREALALVETVAPTPATVLILGETGTGKELVARAIHERSTRRGRPLVKLNCAAISAGLVDSELFGHVRGAFTGASADRVGRFELADGGTLFLDEIGELSPETQAKLLRVLQEREFEPVGSSRTRRVDVRVIAATNRDLERETAAGGFRSDLYFRLNVFPIRVPPLRERAEDVRLLAPYFLEKHALRIGRPLLRIANETLERLAAYPWPGNVRELENVIERAVIVSRGPILDIEPLELRGRETPGPMPAAAAEPRSVADVQRRHIVETLRATDWVIEGERGAARRLGLHPNTLRSRMKKLGIARSAQPE